MKNLNNIKYPLKVTITLKYLESLKRKKIKTKEMEQVSGNIQNTYFEIVVYDLEIMMADTDDQ